MIMVRENSEVVITVPGRLSIRRSNLQGIASCPVEDHDGGMGIQWSKIMGTNKGSRVENNHRMTKNKWNMGDIILYYIIIGESGIFTNNTGYLTHKNGDMKWYYGDFMVE